MKGISQLLLGLLTAIGSIALVVSAASLSILEGGASIPIAITSQPTLLASTPVPVATGLLEPARPTVSPTLTATSIQPTSCPAPEGWNPYLVQPGDTLADLALQVGTTAEKIRKANCLTVSSLFPNTILYLPLAPTATVSAPDTPTPLPTVPATVAPTLCAPPINWVIYIVRPGDTLYKLGVFVGLTADGLRSANCLTSDRIYAGQTLYLPFIPARPSTPTSTATQIPETDTPVPTRTRTATRPTATPVPPTFTPTATDTPPPTATNTPNPTPTTPSPSDTPTATEETSSGLDVDTDTPTP